MVFKIILDDKDDFDAEPEAIYVEGKEDSAKISTIFSKNIDRFYNNDNDEITMDWDIDVIQKSLKEAGLKEVNMSEIKIIY